MRGDDTRQATFISYLDIEDRIPADHPLRSILSLCDTVLKRMDPTFERIYSDHGRESIAPERLLRALLLQILYSVRSERQLMEQVNYNILFRWFIGLSLDENVWHPTTFTKNRDRLLRGDVCQEFLRQVIAEADRRRLLSKEHFSVDGTLMDAWAGMKSFRRKDGDDDEPGPGRNGERNWKGEKLTNETHQSTTDPGSRLARKSNGDASRLTYQANIVIEHRTGLVVAAGACTTTGRSEREEALALLELVDRKARATVGADKGYDTQEFCRQLRAVGITPHVARKKTGSGIDGRTTRHAGYAVSQTIRKRVEEPFGWAKSYGLMRKLRHRGLDLVDSITAFTMAAYNLTRMGRLACA